jgi:hypothetical protein
MTRQTSVEIWCIWFIVYRDQTFFVSISIPQTITMDYFTWVEEDLTKGTDTSEESRACYLKLEQKDLVSDYKTKTKVKV